MSREQMDAIARDNDDQERERISQIRAVTHPYSDQRERLWREVVTASLRAPGSYTDPFLRADRAVIEFDKRFESVT